MAIELNCYLDDTLLDDEPLGLASIVTSIIRDPDFHGIGFEASTTTLEFISNGMAYLEEVLECEGLLANTIFKVDMRCDEDDDFLNIITGKVNYSALKRKCGNYCSISVPIESATCEVTLKNRWDQNVDLDAKATFDPLKGLVAYDDLNIMLILPAKELDYLTEGFVLPNDEPVTVHNFTFVIRPNYGNVIANNFQDSELTGASFISIDGSDGLSPQILWNERLVNFPNPIFVNGRMKGNFHLAAFTPSADSEIRIFFAEGEFISGEVVGTYMQDILIASFPDGVPVPEQDIPFDYTLPEFIWVPVDSGADGLYFYTGSGTAQCPAVTVTFDPETFFKVETTKKVPATDVPAYLIHETLSRMVESVTENCCRVKSSYYGRTDSQPFAFEEDGCGGLRFLTSGLKLRNAPDGKFFANLKQTVTDLQCIDNIGQDVVPDDTSPGNYICRIEGLDFFYQDREIFQALGIPVATGGVDASRFVSTFATGYKKWETQANFGLDEYNANKIYRTALTALTNKLDKTSTLVAGEYPIELTREQTFALTNEADTTYDNDNFIVCLKRLDYYGYPYGGLVVEQGGLDSVSNIFSPGSTYNARISPVRNAMRWFRTVMASYPGIQASTSRMYFTSGTGNLTATGRLADFATNDCTLEKVPLSENQDLLQTLFKDVEKATPLWRNETITFDYPMEIGDYQRIKDDPYGYVTFQCGTGGLERGWITELKYKVFSKLATFTLRKTWVEGPQCAPNIPVLPQG